MKYKNYNVQLFRDDVKIQKNIEVKNEVKIRKKIRKGEINTSGKYKGRVQGGGKKNKIAQFSQKSLRNLKFISNNVGFEYKAMITLTYKKLNGTGKDSKYHLKKFLQYLKYNYPDINYLWFLEFQENKTPHYHILVDKFTNIAKNSEAWDNASLCENEAGVRTEGIKKGHNGIKKYIRKYAQKREQKEVPEGYKDVGRFWGTNFKIKPEEEIILDEEEGINILYKYELYVKNIFPKSEMNWLHEANNIILWNFKKEVKNELREEHNRSKRL